MSDKSNAPEKPTKSDESLSDRNGRQSPPSSGPAQSPKKDNKEKVPAGPRSDRKSKRSGVENHDHLIHLPHGVTVEAENGYLATTIIVRDPRGVRQAIQMAEPVERASSQSESLQNEQADDIEWLSDDIPRPHRPVVIPRSDLIRGDGFASQLPLILLAGICRLLSIPAPASGVPLRDPSPDDPLIGRPGRLRRLPLRPRLLSPSHYVDISMDDSSDNDENDRPNP